MRPLISRSASTTRGSAFRASAFTSAARTRSWRASRETPSYRAARRTSAGSPSRLTDATIARTAVSTRGEDEAARGKPAK